MLTATDPRRAHRLPRSNAFDALRLIAALSITVLHSGDALGVPVGGFEFVEPIMVFFIVSGLFVYASAVSIYERTGSFREFFYNRFLRLAPAMYTFALAAPIVLAIIGVTPWLALLTPEMLIWLGSSAVFVPNYDPAIWSDIGTGSMNGQMYTVPAEVSFYLIVPLLVLIVRKFGFWPMIILMSIVSVLGAYISNTGPELVHTAFHHLFLERAAYFTIGMVIGHLGLRIPLRWWLAVAALAVHMGLRAYQDFGPDTVVLAQLQHDLKPVLCAIPAGYLILYIGVRAPSFIPRFTERIGDWSFGVFLWHYVVINIAMWWGLPGTPLTVLGIVAVTAAIGAASWHLVERRFLTRKRLSLRNTDFTEPTSRKPKITPYQVAP